LTYKQLIIYNGSYKTAQEMGMRMLNTSTPDQNPDVFAAIAHPVRRQLLDILTKGDQSVKELNTPFNISQPAISQHLRVLEDAGLIISRVDGARRPRRLAKAGIDAPDQWLSMIRKALETNYERLDGVLAEMQSNQKEKIR